MYKIYLKGKERERGAGKKNEMFDISIVHETHIVVWLYFPRKCFAHDFFAQV